MIERDEAEEAHDYFEQELDDHCEDSLLFEDEAPREPQARLTLTYGVLPAYWEYSNRYVAGIAEEDGLFSFGNDKRVGTARLSLEELWKELVEAHDEFWKTGNEAAGDWCSSVLGLLGIEWV